MSAASAGGEARQRSVVLKTVSTREADIAARLFSALYGRSVRLDYHGDRRNFVLRSEAVTFGDVTINKATTASWSLSRDTGAYVGLCAPIDGLLQFQIGARLHDYLPNRQIAAWRPFENLTSRVVQGSGLVLSLPVAGIIERAGRLTGETYDESLLDEMSEQIDAKTAVATALVRNMKAAHLEIAGLDSVGMGKLAANGYKELLLDLAVACLFPCVTAHMGGAAKDCGPQVIRQARDYIVEHAAEPIELAQLARRLGISMRAMQENFQRYYGFSPRDYVLECRLDLARQRLLLPIHARSVTEIALESGFSDLSHFSAKYRDKFGEAPSETLRAAQRSLI